MCQSRRFLFPILYIAQREWSNHMLDPFSNTFHFFSSVAGNRIRRGYVGYSYRLYWRTACTPAKPHGLIWAITSRICRAERRAGFPSVRPKLSRLRAQHIWVHVLRFRSRTHYIFSRRGAHAGSSRDIVRIPSVAGLCASRCWRWPEYRTAIEPASFPPWRRRY